MKTTDPVLRLLRTRQRRETWLWPGLIAVTGLVVALVVVAWWWSAAGLSPSIVGAWAGIVGATALVAGLVLLRRRRDLQRIAREIDRELHDRNRLEAAAELAGSPTALAAAQREEASIYLRSAPVPRWSWLPPVATLLVLLGLMHVGLLGVWAVQLVRTGWAQTVVAEEPSVEAPDPAATIKWVTPDPEIKATAIEAVPLTAQAQSETGLRDFTLEMAVNGVPSKSVPLPDSDTAPGDAKVDLELYLDELEVEPFDMVSYYLTARRVAPQALKPTASELQFVQIRRARDDAYEMPGGLGYAVQSHHLLIKLKLAQLGLVKQNFLLAHTDLSHAAEPWQTENDRVGGEQTTLAEKTAQVIEFMITENVPPEVLNLLKQSQPEMRRAGALIGEEKNQPATEPQGRALGLISECEKLFLKVFAKGKVVGDPGKGPPKDPFTDKQKFELSNRLETPAGELEAIEMKQAEVLDDIPAGTSDEQTLPSESDSPSSGGGGELVKQQEEIEEKIAELSQSEKLPPAAREALEKALAAAKEARERLAAGDRPGAVEASARALQQIQEAVAAVQGEGEQAAQEALAAAQRELNRAAAEASAAEAGQGAERAQAAAEALAATRDALRREAERQQQGGSAAAAARLAALAGKTGEEGLGKALESLAKGKGKGKGEGQGQGGGGSGGAAGRIGRLASEAGKASLAALSRPEALSEVATNLAQASATLERLATRGVTSGPAVEEALADLTAAAQQAETLVTGQTVANQVENILRETSQAPDLRRVSLAVLIQSVARPAADVIALLRAAAQDGQRDRAIVLVNPEDAPEGYRDSVADYFERLSKDFRQEEIPAP